MSDLPLQSESASPARFAGKWQIPLLLVSAAALAVGLWRLKPQPVPPTFEELYAKAENLRARARRV
jgi:hypothetical protein